jgi:hypothetical protein
MHPDPSEHTLQPRIFIEPMTSSSVGIAKVANNVLIGYL